MNEIQAFKAIINEIGVLVQSKPVYIAENEGIECISAKIDTGKQTISTYLVHLVENALENRTTFSIKAEPYRIFFIFRPVLTGNV
jgi:hypothetical protein